MSQNILKRFEAFLDTEVGVAWVNSLLADARGPLRFQRDVKAKQVGEAVGRGDKARVAILQAEIDEIDCRLAPLAHFVADEPPR